MKNFIYFLAFMFVWFLSMFYHDLDIRNTVINGGEYHLWSEGIVVLKKEERK